MLKRITDPDGWRFYVEDESKPEDWLISVTRVLEVYTPQRLKQYFINNSKAKQEKVLKETADIGTKIHADIEAKHKNETTDNTGIDQTIENWLALKQKHNIKAVHSELYLGSQAMGVAGTVDLIMEFDGKLAVADIKTGFFGKKAGMQMACYRAIAIENGLCDESVGMVGISVHRDGRVAEPFVYEHFGWCFKGFLACLELFKDENFAKLTKQNWKWLHDNSFKFGL